MASDTLTLALNGAILLKEFALVMGEFTKLVEALSDEVAGPSVEINWEISRLENGSAVTAIRGLYTETKADEADADEADTDEIDPIERVVKAYETVGYALEQQQPIPYSEEVAYHARRLTRVINGHVKSIEFITDDFRAQVNEKRTKPERRQKSIGVVTGLVRTITERQHPQSIRLTVIDPLSSKVVFCYLNRDQAELAREVWLKRVSVLGLIYRHPTTGRPIDVQDIKKIEITNQAQPFSYRQARGIIPWREGNVPSDVLLRRLRDAN
jgi:hypothetical protein